MNCPKDDSGDCCGLCNYNPVVVIATHDRIDITTRNINSLKLQTPQPKIVIICSDQQELEYYKMLGVSVALEPNKPLGRKWQVGVNVAAKLEANPVIILGSDDILADGYIKKALLKLNEGYDFIGTTHWITLNPENNEKYHCQYIGQNEDYPIGSGKVYSKSILEKIRYKVFDMIANRRLDDNGYMRIKKNQARMYLIKEPMILAVKGSWQQLNPIDKYLNVPTINAEKMEGELTNFKW